MFHLPDRGREEEFCVRIPKRNEIVTCVFAPSVPLAPVCLQHGTRSLTGGLMGNQTQRLY